jgi:hypothetical protein
LKEGPRVVVDIQNTDVAGLVLLLIGALFVFYGSIRQPSALSARPLPPILSPTTAGIGWYDTTVGLLQRFASLTAGVLWHPSAAKASSSSAPSSPFWAASRCSGWLIPDAHERAH